MTHNRQSSNDWLMSVSYQMLLRNYNLLFLHFDI